MRIYWLRNANKHSIEMEVIPSKKVSKFGDFKLLMTETRNNKIKTNLFMNSKVFMLEKITG